MKKASRCNGNECKDDECKDEALVALPAQIFRSGWEVRSIHSLFDDVNATPLLMQLQHGELMEETNSVSPPSQVFRSGWEVRSIHSLFEYVNPTPPFMQQTGGTVSD